jgi:pentatricopeptide repeat protein
VKPDRVVFNALITACGQSGAVDRAFDVLAEMGAETQPIDPDHVTIGALIKACANAGQVRLFVLFFFFWKKQLFLITRTVWSFSLQLLGMCVTFHVSLSIQFFN